MRIEDFKKDMIVMTTAKSSKRFIKAHNKGSVTSFQTVQHVVNSYTGHYEDMPYGTKLKCIFVGMATYGSSNRPVFVKVDENGIEDYSYFYYVDSWGNHQYIEPSEISAIAKLSDRERKAFHVKSNIEILEKREEELSEELSQVKDKLSNAKIRLSKLERFKTDEEELAFTFSQIMKTGGNYESILHILKNRETTEKL